MSTIIGSHPNSSGLGDLLVCTPICRHLDCIVQLHPKTKYLSRVFDNIAKVEYTENPFVTPDIGHDGHYTTRKMRYYGIENKCNLPYVLTTKEEDQKAIETLSKIDLKNKKPVIFVPNCSPQWKHIREMDKKFWDEFIQFYDKKYTFLQFGVSNNYTQFNTENVIQFKDYDIRDTIAIYKQVKNYVGVNTGDYHLMMAVDGICYTYTPENGNGYYNEEWMYSDKKSIRIPFYDKRTIEL